MGVTNSSSGKRRKNSTSATGCSKQASGLAFGVGWKGAYICLGMVTAEEKPGWESVVNDWLPSLARAASCLVLLTGALVLVGWVFNLDFLMRISARHPAMNPASAVAFVLAGAALWRCTKYPIDFKTILLAGTVVGIGAVKLLAHCFGIGLQIDQLISGRGEAPGGAPDQMAVATAVNFILIGFALIGLDVQTRKGTRLAQGLTVAAGLISLIALVGYSYKVMSFYRLGGGHPMALHTALCFALLCLGLLAARPRAGFMQVLTSETTGGAVARRLLPMAILVPWVLGGIRLMGEKLGYYPSEFGVGLFSLACLVIFTALVWWNSRLLYRADLERVRTERRLAVQYECTRILAESRTVSDAAPALLQVICETLGWAVGAFWLLDQRSKEMRCEALWHFAHTTFDEFARMTRSLSYPAGVGLPGRVLASGQPTWVADVAGDAGLPRAQTAGRAGLHAAFAFPVRIGNEVCGALEFFNETIGPADRKLLAMFDAMGTQIGQFVERQLAEERLRNASKNLERSNTDLQQFAYVASHDLFEPLRMVISYLQLLNHRHGGALTGEAREFIGYAVDGAMRMQALIHDLLAYSRLDYRGRPFEPVDCNKVLEAALANLKVAIEETGAE
ncbi:MAG TPA: GAF domain-containing protein, partial [Clostridia bacterium]|nr:GAF domain-containing protein [Clostridia bacterium]